MKEKNLQLQSWNVESHVSFYKEKKASTVHVLANWLNSCAKRQFKV